MKYKYNPGDYLGPYKIKMVERVRKDNKQWYCSFICPWHEDDNHIFEARIDHVTSGRIRSCGCQSSRIKNTTTKYHPGMRIGPYNILFVEEISKNQMKDNKRIRRQGRFLCPWHENEPVYFKASVENVASGHTSSCGCKCSLGEEKVHNVLKENGFKVERQYTFNDCKSNKYNTTLRFDFYLPDYNCCIEYQGQQHYEYTSGWNNKNNFEHRQELDEDKRRYCKKHNIKLIEIPFTDFDIIDKKYILKKLNE